MQSTQQYKQSPYRTSTHYKDTKTIHTIHPIRFVNIPVSSVTICNFYWEFSFWNCKTARRYCENVKCFSVWTDEQIYLHTWHLVQTQTINLFTDHIQNTHIVRKLPIMNMMTRQNSEVLYTVQAEYNACALSSLQNNTKYEYKRNSRHKYRSPAGKQASEFCWNTFLHTAWTTQSLTVTIQESRRGGFPV
jgi:hypothetical protein